VGFVMNTKYIWTDNQRLGGKPCIRNHRFSIAQLLAELAEGDRGLKEIADDFDMDLKEVCGAIEDVSMMFNMSWVDGPPKDARETEINEYYRENPVENSD
jgi:uncharacterized protein (DUF433 family)